MSLLRPGDELPVTFEVAFGADLTADPATWTWTDLSTRMKRQETTTRGRQDATSQTQPSQLTVSLHNTDGWLTPNLPGSPWYQRWDVGTPVRLSITVGGTTYTRFQGRVQATPPVWPEGNSDYAEVAVTARGILYQLGLANTPAKSPMYVAIAGDSPLAYWPGEDGSKSNQVAAAAGGQPAILSGDAATFGSGGPAGSQPLITFGAGTSMNAPVSMLTGVTGWTVEFYVKIPSAPSAGPTPVMQWQTLGSMVQWRFTVFPTTNQIGMEIWNFPGNQVSNSKVTYSSPDVYGKDLFVSVSARQNGSAIQYEWVAHTSTSTSWSAAGSSIASSTLGPVISLQVPAADPSATWDRTGWIYGHWGAWPSVLDTSWGSLTFSHYRYLTGNAGESPLTRITSVAAQAGIPFTARGSSAEKSLGARPTATPLAVMREAELADLGILTDGLDAGLNYLPGRDRYNLAAAMTLDVNRNQVKLPFAPQADDQRLQTVMTVSRSSGSSATYTDPLAATKGEYPGSVTLNLADDSTLLQQAAWRAHLATVAEMRVPTITLNLRDRPELIAPWLAMDIGSRYTLTDPLDQYAGDVDQVLEMYVETIDSLTWLVTLTGSPYAPWRVFVLDSDRLDGQASTLHTSVAAGATSLSVDTASGYPLWTRRAGAFPFDLSVGGYQVTVTNITGSSSPQTFTVKPMPGAVSAGAQVKLWKPAVLAL